MNRRDFFLKSALASTALLVGDEVWEYLNHRKIYPVGVRFSQTMTEDNLYGNTHLTGRHFEKMVLYSRRYSMSPERFRDIIIRTDAE